MSPLSFTTTRHAIKPHSVLPQQVESPILAYTAEGEVNALEWYQQNGERNWVGIAFDNKMQILRV